MMKPRLMKKCTVGNSNISGGGVFAAEKISKGDIVYENFFVPPSKEAQEQGYVLITLDDFENLDNEDYLKKAANDYSQLLGENLLLVLDDRKLPREEFATFSFNHSCEPMLVPEGNHLIAVRDIEEGEELLTDYGTTEYTETEFGFMKCECGASCCRGILAPQDALTPELRAKFGTHFAPYILAALKKKGLL